jgi:TPR repeat protein
VKRNVQASVKLFYNGAKKNDPESMFNYGVSLITSADQKNIKEAISIFETSANLVKKKTNSQNKGFFIF